MRNRIWRTEIPRRGGSDALHADVASRARPRAHRGLSPEQEAVLEIQRLAGNAAARQAVAQARSSGKVASVDAMSLTRTGKGPAKGISEIRTLAKGASVLAYTVRSIENRPPIMLPDSPEKVDGGFACRAQKVDSIGEPDVKEWWPKQGRHKVAPTTYIQVSPEWATKLEQGEDEHGRDATTAWELTWKLVQDTINKFAVKPGPVAPTPDAAERALWKKYVAALPEDLRPEGDTVNPAKQLDVLAARRGTFFAWMWEATISRDSRHYHETTTTPSSTAKNVPKGAVVNDIEPDEKFEVPGTDTPKFLKELRDEYRPGKVNVASTME